MTVREELDITLTPPPAARPGAKAIIEGVQENIEAQALLLATKDTTYDPNLLGWLLNQGLLSAEGLSAPEGQSVMAHDYSSRQEEIDKATHDMRLKNDAVKNSAVAAFHTKNKTFQAILDKVEGLNTRMAAAPGPSEGEIYMPIVAEYAVIRDALQTLSSIIDLVDDTYAGMEARAGEIERSSPGNNGDPRTIWGATSPKSTARYTSNDDGTVEEVLRIAEAELERGVSERGYNTAIYNDTKEKTPYNIDDAWCASFASYTWEKAGYEVHWTNKNYVPAIWNDAKSMGLARHTADAQPGDMIIFDWQGDGNPDHIGIVKSVNGNTITTIEGNSGDRVASHTYQMGNTDVVGVVKPPPSTQPATAR
ncbi:CHAP domain-containing protein [Nocardia sp. X0981]